RLGTKAKSATSCGNAFVTNIVLASCPRKASARNGNQRILLKSTTKNVSTEMYSRFIFYSFNYNFNIQKVVLSYKILGECYREKCDTFLKI
ncbi:hypothetical protein ABHM95_01145, partial [Solibacillus isronensis]|uniref:hypothetical protein n=1 Tax=Solibacillus isronensis TaxID=412383 RepID=UPI003D26D269